MKADDPRHNTPGQPATERVAGCNCTRCEAARTKWRRDRKLRKMGRPNLVPVAHVRTHIQRLLDAGWTQAKIASAAGVSAATISEARNGVASHMRANTAAKLLQVAPADADSWRVPSIGTVRRLQALGALGWPSRQVCAMAGLSERFGALLTAKNRTTLTRAAAEAIAAVYEDLHMVPPPEGRTHNHVRAFARNRGWAPPLAWDDIDTDEKPRGVGFKARHVNDGTNAGECDPTVVARIVAGDWRLPCTPAEKSAVIRRWVARGGSQNELERLTGWNVNRYAPRGDAA